MFSQYLSSHWENLSQRSKENSNKYTTLEAHEPQFPHLKHILTTSQIDKVFGYFVCMIKENSTKRKEKNWCLMLGRKCFH